MNISTNLEIIDNVIQNDNVMLNIIEHPMEPFGVRYWDFWRTDSHKFHMPTEKFLEIRSPQACSWLRDQEYLVDFKYYETLEFKDGGSTNYLQMTLKIR